MKYRQLINRVQEYSGDFSDEESRDALEMMVESLAVHLTEGERKDFASQLPQELQDIALSVYATEENSNEDMVQQFMELEDIDEAHAKKQMRAAWRALREVLGGGQVEHIKAQLPRSTLGIMS
jgi:uncharacterized protein (DUF2267 family)